MLARRTETTIAFEMIGYGLSGLGLGSLVRRGVRDLRKSNHREEHQDPRHGKTPPGTRRTWASC